MKNGLLTSTSLIGKYITNKKSLEQGNDIISSINLQQNYTHQHPFILCKFDLFGNRLYLLDTKGILIHLNLNDCSHSILKGQKIQNYTVDGNNSLSILFVSDKSQLYRVSMQNKILTKITNLNMNKIIAFERNDYRQMILSLDYKILFLCNVHKIGPLQVKSLKAKGDQIFTNACFSTNNRFIILAIKNIIIRIVQIMDFKTVHQITLPFAVQNLKIQVSYDCRHIVIYGNCNIIFFISPCQSQKYQYQLIQIHFLKTVSKLRYTKQNDIIFLGNDQILYGTSSNQLDKAVPLFNQEYHVRIMSFDISHDCTKIAIVSNRTVMQIKFSEGLHKEIEKKPTWRQMQYRKNGFEARKEISEPRIQYSQEQIEQIKQQGKKIQYQDEDQQQQMQQKQKQSQIKLKDLIKKNVPSYKQQCGSLHQVIQDLKGVTSEIKVQINSIVNNLMEISSDIVTRKTSSVVKGLLKLIREYKLQPQKCFTVMSFVIDCLQKQKQRIKHYGLVLCPQIKAIIQRKFNLIFSDFLQQQILNLYGNYFKGQQWIDAINWIVSAGVNQKSENVPMLMISILQNIHEQLKKAKKQQYKFLLSSQQLNLKFLDIYNKMLKIYLDKKYKNLFINKKLLQLEIDTNKKQHNTKKNTQNKLEELILRQQEIKKNLLNLKKQKQTHYN